MQIQLPLLYFLDGCMYKWVSRFSYRCCTSLTGACTSEFPHDADSFTAAVLPWRVHVQVSIHDADSVTAAVLPWRVHVQVSIQIQLPLLYFLDGCMYKWVSTWCRFSYRCCTSLTGACTSEYPDSVTAAVLPWRVHVQVSIQIQLPLLYFLDGCMYKWVSTWCRFSYRCCTSLTDACTSEYPDSVTAAVLPWRVHVQVSIHDADSVTAAVRPWRMHVQVSIHDADSVTAAVLPWRVHVQVSIHMMQIQLPLLYFLDGCMYKWVSRFSYRCCTSLTGACTSEHPDSVFSAVLPWRVHVQVSIQIQLPLLYFLDGCMYKWVSRFSYLCCTSLMGACTSEYPHDADSVTAAVLPWRVHVQVSIHENQSQRRPHIKKPK